MAEGKYLPWKQQKLNIRPTPGECSLTGFIFLVPGLSAAVCPPQCLSFLVSDTRLVSQYHVRQRGRVDLAKQLDAPLPCRQTVSSPVGHINSAHPTQTEHAGLARQLSTFLETSLPPRGLYTPMFVAFPLVYD